jgi:hypothetical protein
MDPQDGLACERGIMQSRKVLTQAPHDYVDITHTWLLPLNSFNAARVVILGVRRLAGGRA